MERFEQRQSRIGYGNGRRMAAALLVGIAFVATAIAAAAAQTFTVIHNFNGTDGSQPFAGVTRDTAGNLYGTTQYGGILSCDSGGVPGCGVAYKLRPFNSGWLFSVLYQFQGNEGNFLPTDPGNITLAPNGVPFGPQVMGGSGFDGLIYNLQPPVTAPANANAPWSYTVDHVFGMGNDGGGPSQVTFDPAGNIFGTAIGGGIGNSGVVYELTPSNGGWTETILYSFLGGSDGNEPDAVSLDESGNIFGLTRAGGDSACGDNNGCGTIYELTRSGSGWTKTILHVFEEATDGSTPGPLLRDSAGNLYGVTAMATSGGGTIWELSPSNGGWVFNVLYTLPGRAGTLSLVFRPVMDASGALYGVNNYIGANNVGSVYKLAPSNGGWTYADLHDFGSLPNQTDGCFPRGPVALDPTGNIYGTTQQCGEGGGVIYEVSP